MLIHNILHTDILIFGGTAAAVDFALSQQKEHRVLLVTGFTYFGEEQCAYLECHDAAPLEIKRRLDRKVLENHLDFRFRSWPLKLTGNAVVFGCHEGIFAVQAGVAVDFSLNHTLARLSGDILKPFEPGRKKFHRTIITRQHHVETLEGEVHLADDSISSWEHAEAEARQKTWSNRHLFTADFCHFDCPVSLLSRTPDHGIMLPEQLPGKLLVPSRPLESKIELGSLPVLKHVQVLIVGGGTAGAPAGIAVGRQGVKALVLEELAHPGGTGTEGRIAGYWFGLDCGFTKEVNREVQELQGDQFPNLSPIHWSVECKQHYWERELLKAGTEIWYQYTCCGCLRDNGQITAAIAAGPYGGGLILAEQFIDATGNADLAAFCQAPTVFDDYDEPALQGAAICPHILGQDCANADYMFIVDSSNQDTARAFITGRDRHRDKVFFDMAKIPGTRERRRIVGEITFEPPDFYANRTYPDTIHLARSNFDTHGFTIHPFLLFCPTDETAKTVQIPLRALLCPSLKNLLTTGLGISAHRDAMPLIRMQADVQNQGYAAGLTAAMAVRQKTPLRGIDMKALQKTLEEIGILPRELMEENSPQSEKTTREAEIFLNPDFRQLVRKFQEKPDFEQALRLVLLKHPAGVSYLEETLRHSKWDRGWNYRGMGQFGMSSSRLDAAILGLAELSKDFSPMAGLLKQMSAQTEFSHIRSCCHFLIKHPDKSYAATLETILGQFQCHARPDFLSTLDAPCRNDVDVSERNLQLKEIYLAGALHACQSDNSLALSFLRQYAQGVHRFFAIHAKKLLG